MRTSRFGGNLTVSLTIKEADVPKSDVVKGLDLISLSHISFSLMNFVEAYLSFFF